MRKSLVSAVIITKNEEAHITRCLGSLAWVDEILVVDAESTDKTAIICQHPAQPWSNKLHWVSRPWTGFRDQRNFAIRHAKNPWVLVVDADEECSPQLQKKITSFFENGAEPPCRAYKIRRIEFFLGRQIQYGIWNPSYQDRFFYRDGVSYQNDIHEYPLFLVHPEKIEEPLIHSPDFAPDKFLKKMNEYTTLEAKARVENGQRTNLVRLFFAFPAMFLKNYFYYKAYKDGIHGFVISLLEGISRVVRHIKIWQFSSKASCVSCVPQEKHQ